MSTATLLVTAKSCQFGCERLTLSECDRLTLSFRVFRVNYVSVISRGPGIALLTMWHTALLISIFRFSKAAVHMLSGGFRSSVSKRMGESFCSSRLNCSFGYVWLHFYGLLLQQAKNPADKSSLKTILEKRAATEIRIDFTEICSLVGKIYPLPSLFVNQPTLATQKHVLFLTTKFYLECKSAYFKWDM
jgi:hypothetical protein